MESGCPEVLQEPPTWTQLKWEREDLLGSSWAERGAWGRRGNRAGAKRGFHRSPLVWPVREGHGRRLGRADSCLLHGGWGPRSEYTPCAQVYCCGKQTGATAQCSVQDGGSECLPQTWGRAARRVGVGQGRSPGKSSSGLSDSPWGSQLGVGVAGGPGHTPHWEGHHSSETTF